MALLTAAQILGVQIDAASRERAAAHQYNFDPQRKLMSTLDTDAGHDWLHTKGAPESVLPRCVDVPLSRSAGSCRWSRPSGSA